MLLQKASVALMSALLSGVLAAMITASAAGQEQGARKARYKVAPAYPELARRMHIVGVVKVQVTVAPDGAVKETRLLGGHPVLANAVQDVVKKWRFETRPQETTENLEFRFDPTE